MVFAAQELRSDNDCELLQMAASQYSEIINSIFLPSRDWYSSYVVYLLYGRFISAYPLIDPKLNCPVCSHHSHVDCCLSSVIGPASLWEIGTIEQITGIIITIATEKK